MPDISKINALDIGSVAKMDGLAKASILDIDGVAVPAAWSPTLDTYTGAKTGWSVRLLRTAYKTGGGTIMRVRRASDSVEADVGFDADNQLGLTSPITNTSDGLSYTDFADFVDHTGTPTDGFVRYWYDQSGNAIDAGQSTAGNQPKIYDSTTPDFTKEAGIVALDITRTSSFVGQYLDVSAAQWQDANGLMTIFSAFRIDGSTGGQVWNDNAGGVNRSFQTGAGTYYSMTTITGSTPSSYDTSSIPTVVNDAPHICSGIVTNGTVEQNVDGTQTDTVSTVVNARVGSFAARIGARAGASIEATLDGRIHELIHYSSALGATTIGNVEDSLNDYYQTF